MSDLIHENILLTDVHCTQPGNKDYLFKPSKIIVEGEKGEESINVTEDKLQLDEGKRIVAVEGIFAIADEPTANGRVYSYNLWANLLSEESSAMQMLRAGGMIGELNHPANGTANLKDSAIKIVSLRLREDKSIYGRAELLDTEDVPCAKIMRGLIKSGARLGISSRGRGSVSTSGVVQDDYNLEAFDVVKNPAVSSAILQPISESKNINNKGGNMDLQTILESITARTIEVTEVVDTSRAMTPAMKTLLTDSVKVAIAELDPLIKQEDKPSVKTEATELQKKLLEYKKKISEAKTPEELNEETTTTPDADTNIVDVADLLTQPAKTEDDAAAKLKAEEEAKVKAEQDAKAKAEKEAKEKAAKEAKAKADAAAKAKAKAKEDEDDTDYTTVEDVEKLRARIKVLEDANKEKAEANNQLVKDMKLQDEALAELQQTIQKTEELYTKAMVVIKEMNQKAEQEKIDAKVKEAVEKNPQLGKLTKLLSEAKTVEEVDQRITDFSEALKVDKKTKTTRSVGLPAPGGDALSEISDDDTQTTVKKAGTVQETVAAIGRSRKQRLAENKSK